MTDEELKEEEIRLLAAERDALTHRVHLLQGAGDWLAITAGTTKEVKGTDHGLQEALDRWDDLTQNDKPESPPQ